MALRIWIDEWFNTNDNYISHNHKLEGLYEDFRYISFNTKILNELLHCKED